MTWLRALMLRSSLLERTPLRLRLALRFFLIFSVVTLALSGASVWMVHDGINALEDNELHQRVRSVSRFLQAHNGAAPEGDDSDIEAQMTGVFDNTHGGKWLQVIDQDGHWIYRAKHIAQLYPTLALPAAADPAGRTFNFTSGDTQVRALIAPIDVNGRRYTVQTGTTLNKSVAILGNFQRQLFVLTPLMLLLAAGFGYWTSRSVLAPVALLAAEARRINGLTPQARLPELRTNDELADMSLTLNAMLERIEGAQRGIRQFTANAAHELRTPLSRMRMAAELAQSRPRTAGEYQETLAEIERETIRTAEIIDVLLAIARADGGVDKPRFEVLDLPSVVAEVCGPWQKQFSESGIELGVSDVRGASPAQHLVAADRPSLQRLLHILIENAWRYTAAGGRVTVTTKAEAGHTLLQVTDTGTGIAPADLDRIFERFYRSGTAINGDYRGSGLGLALATRIAERHKATITVTSEVGRGSTFQVLLPTHNG